MELLQSLDIPERKWDSISESRSRSTFDQEEKQRNMGSRRLTNQDSVVYSHAEYLDIGSIGYGVPQGNC